MSSTDPHTIQISQLPEFAAIACKAMNGPELPNDQITIEHITKLIPQIIDKMEPKAFFQWLCPFWQCCEFMYVGSDSASDWIELVNWFVTPLTSRPSAKIEFTHPTCRAMCVSYILTSLANHVEAQAYTLRILVLYATRAGLATNHIFVSWLLKFMKDRIDRTLSMKENRELFIDTLIGFFNSVTTFNMVSIITILHFFDHPRFLEYTEKHQQCLPQIKAISTRILNQALNFKLALQHNEKICTQIFVFEAILKTKLLSENLDANHLALLNILVSDTLEEFKKFQSSNAAFFDEEKLDQSIILNKMTLLSILSIAQNLKVISFQDLSQKLGCDVFGAKKLMVQINTLHIASIKIDAVNNQFIIEQCQPRLFDQAEWDKTTSEVDRLIAALK